MEYKVLCSIVVFYPKNNATDEKVVSETKTRWGEPVCSHKMMQYAAYNKEGDPKVKRVALFALLSFILLQRVICKKKIAILLKFKRIAIVCLESFYYL